MKKKILLFFFCFSVISSFAQGDCNSVTDPRGLCNSATTTAGTVGNTCNLATCASFSGTISTCIGTCASSSTSYTYTVTPPLTCISGAGKRVGPVTGFNAVATGGIIEKVLVTLGNDPTKPNGRTLLNSGCSNSLVANCYEIGTNLYIKSMVFTVHWTTASTGNEIQIFLYSQQDQGNSNSQPPNYLSYYISTGISTYSAPPTMPAVINVSSPTFSPCGWHIGTGNYTDAYDYVWTVPSGTVLQNNSPYLESIYYGTGPIVAENQTVSASVYTRNGCGISGTRSVSGLAVPNNTSCGSRVATSLQNDVHDQSQPDLFVYSIPGTKSVSVINSTNRIRQIAVYSSIGALVKNIKPDKESVITANLQGCAAGIYIVRIFTTDGSSTVTKVFVQ